MWELDHKEGWVPKKWCFWTVVLEKTLESPLDCKEIKAVNPKGNQLWIFIGRVDAEDEVPKLCLPDGKSWLIGKDPDAGKDWGQEGGDRWWDDWIASLTQWTWVWANSGRYWRTGRLARCSLWGCRVRHDLATEQQQYLHFHTFNGEDEDRSLVGELNRTGHGATRPGCLNYWGWSALEPVLQLASLWATTQGPRTSTKEPTWHSEDPACHSWDPMQPNKSITTLKKEE